ncbi:MAG: hypothetical protein GY827_06620, partial [Cytophagales bacterium]|nr:hypothetical protein [Cytophagales bacterium]
MDTKKLLNFWCFLMICIVVPSWAQTADFYATPLESCENATIFFVDQSTGATTWDWDFGVDASPATATGAGPHIVTYTSSGQKEISLTVDQGLGTETTETKPNYVDIQGVPLAPTAINGSGCSGSEIVLGASGLTGGTYKWYDMSTGGTLLGTGATFKTPSLAVDTDYYVSYVTSGGCESATRTTVSATISTVPTASLDNVVASSICNGASADLEFTLTGASPWTISISDGSDTQVIGGI